MDEAVQEAKLLRQVNALIVAHLRGQSLGQAAAAVAVAMTPMSTAEGEEERVKKKKRRGKRDREAAKRAHFYAREMRIWQLSEDKELE